MDSITPGPKLVINCPACKIQGAIAVTATAEKTAKLFGLIPLFTSTTVEVHCTRCATRFSSYRSCDALAGMPPEQLSRILERNSSGSDIFALMVICWVPFVGIMFSLGVFGRYRGRPVKWTLYAVALSVLSTLATIAGICCVGT